MGSTPLRLSILTCKYRVTQTITPEVSKEKVYGTLYRNVLSGCSSTDLDHID